MTREPEPKDLDRKPGETDEEYRARIGELTRIVAQREDRIACNDSLFIRIDPPPHIDPKPAPADTDDDLHF